MSSINATTGAPLTEEARLQQSVADILLTPIGSRVMRRAYGSALRALVDAPRNQLLIIDIIAATAAALGRWEPRVRVERVTVAMSDAVGHVLIELDLYWVSQARRLRHVVTV